MKANILTAITLFIFAPALLIAAPAWAASPRPTCKVEYRGCTSSLDGAAVPMAALKCIDGFEACARECVAVRPELHQSSAEDRIGPWLGLNLSPATGNRGNVGAARR